MDDRWVALLGWQAAAYQCQAREQWIGWSWVLRRQRLHLVLPHRLMLPWANYRYPLFM
ncbi:MAG: Druantia anti-phage system protein DruA [Acidithiobacillus sp.]